MKTATMPTAPNGAPNPGSELMLGRYTLGKTLGSGNFSIVKLATDEAGHKWAIKVVQKDRVVKEGMEDQFKREVAVMRLLKHRFIMEMREVLESNRHYYLVLEFVPGGEVFEKLAKAERFNEATSRTYFQQLVAGMHFCHSLGFAHRDLKPENLLLDANGHLKISDFGLCNKQERFFMETICGTPSYVAPEVMDNKGYNGLAADVWSLGTILYVFLVGKLPFEAKDPRKNAQLAKQGHYFIPPFVPDGAKDLIRRMLCPSPMHRLNLDQVIAHPWFQVGWDPSLLKGQ